MATSWTLLPAAITAMAAIGASPACSRSVLRTGVDAAIADAVTAAADDGTASGVDAIATAAACWGDERDLLPACTELNACSDRIDGECTQTAECELTFATPLSSFMMVSVNCVGVIELAASDTGDGWTLSDDRHTLLLVGTACDAARGSSPPRILVRQVHSCIF